MRGGTGGVGERGGGGGGVTVYLGDLVQPTNNQTIRTNSQTNRGIGWDFECE